MIDQYSPNPQFESAAPAYQPLPPVEPVMSQLSPASEMRMMKFKGIRFFVMGIVGVAVVVSVLWFLGVFSNASNTITTAGTATQSFDSQKATINILYTKRSTDRSTLLSASQTEFGSIAQALKNLPIDSLTQSTYQLVPVTTSDAIQTLYEYRQAASIVVSGKDNINAVENSLGSANVFVAQTTFLPADETAARNQLLTAAVADAQAKAEVLAKAAHRSLGGVQSVAEVANSNGGGTATSSTPASGTDQVSLQTVVNVTYQLR